LNWYLVSKSFKITRCRLLGLFWNRSVRSQRATLSRIELPNRTHSETSNENLFLLAIALITKIYVWFINCTLWKLSEQNCAVEVSTGPFFRQDPSSHGSV